MIRQPETIGCNYRLIGYCCALWVFLVSPTLQAQQNVQVRSEDGYLWVQANNASAIELAEQISRSLGINVVVTGDTESRINLDIVEEPVDKALAKLSPSNMLVRDGSSADADIIEVILMMGEGSDSGSSASQFLPSGSPADVVVPADQSEQLEQGADPVATRNPDRARLVREAAIAARSDPDLPPDQVPPMFAEDQADSDAVIIDPVTGLPVPNQPVPNQ